MAVCFRLTHIMWPLYDINRLIAALVSTIRELGREHDLETEMENGLREEEML